MADDDFDIDIYGDASIEDGPFKKNEDEDVKVEGPQDPTSDGHHIDPVELGDLPDEIQIKTQDEPEAQDHTRQKIKSTDESGQNALNIPKQAPQRQGMKRKEGSDDRPIDPGATSAVLISDLHWWNTDDDIRGWVNQAECEDELKDITFSEHKVNGKSKGQVYVEFTSQQAATAAKRKIDAFSDGQQYAKKHSVTYSNPNVNPFRTLPKDAPMRANKDGSGPRSNITSYNDQNRQNSFRGGRGASYNSNRGASGNVGSFNRNFSGPHMGGMSGGFQPAMGGFQGNAMATQFGVFNRGGMVGNGMRGGGMRRGGGVMANGTMGPIPMGGMPMGGMPMTGMAGPMGMGQMGGGMPGVNFQGMQPHFNPAFFQQNQGAGADWQNPHGAKRPRPE